MRTVNMKAVETVTAKSAKNNFGELLQKVANNQAVSLTKHGKAAAYLIPPEMFERVARLAQTDSDPMEALRADFDAMLARMQTPENVALGKSLLDMDDAQLLHRFRGSRKQATRR